MSEPELDAPLASRPLLIKPTLRCFAPVWLTQPVACGAIATRQAKELEHGVRRYWCDSHSGSATDPIAGTVDFRRVHVVCSVLFAGASLVRQTAEAEALARLERAVESAGGVLNLVDARSELGHWKPLYELAATRAARG